MTSRKTIAIIGAGHNALVCACTWRKRATTSAVFEGRSRVGGAVNTEEIWRLPGRHMLRDAHPDPQDPGYQGATVHRFGLEYMQMDPWGFAPFPEWSEAESSLIVFRRDLDRTCRSIAVIQERDAEAYRDLC